MSIWTLLLTSEEVLDVCALLDEVGVPYTYFEQENVELDTPGELVYPTQACESCFWLDPKSKGLCGYREWESAVVQDALDLHEKARQDAKDCPLNE